MTTIEMIAAVGEDRQVHFPPNCPVGSHRVVIYIEEANHQEQADLPLGNPPLRRKNGVLVLNLPDEPLLTLDTDSILDEIREERLRSAMGSNE